MIEMLVTIVLFSVALIGLMGVLAQARSLSTDAEDRNRAVVLANDLASQVILFRSSTLPTTFMSTWLANVASNPANGGLQGVVAATTGVTPGADPRVATITITWNSVNSQKLSGLKTQTHSYTTSVALP